MKGDFTRDTFNRPKGYSQVLMQQGRVQLDADFNEQSAILLHCLRAVVKDFVGPFGGPVNSGFKIKLDAVPKSDFKIEAGHYYVDGILCENGEAGDASADTAYSAVKLPGDLTGTAGRYLVYLDVWERFVNYLDDDAMRESALGGPDTAGRAKVISQVRTTGRLADNITLIPENANNNYVKTNWQTWVDAWQPMHRGSLKAQVVDPDGDNTDPCLTSPDAKYRGDANRLYRVEVHQPGKAGTATFKWSRENGSVVTAWLKSEDPRIVVRDAGGFAANQWVELIDDDDELSGQPGQLGKVTHVEDDALTIELPSGTPLKHLNLDKHPKVRRWDQTETEKTHLRADDRGVYGDVVINENTWLALEDGIQIYFGSVGEGADPHHIYRSGDYWLIPARVATGGIEWPTTGGTAQALPPHGIEHHYAPLGLITADAAGNLSAAEDSRTCFKLTDGACV